MKTITIVGVAVVLAIGLPVACSLISTTASVSTAPGRVVRKTLETDNIIGSYNAFFERKANYDAVIDQIETHKQVMAETPKDDAAEQSRLRIELAGMRQSCRYLATGYNADSAKINKAVFRDKDLPITLSEEACNA